MTFTFSATPAFAETPRATDQFANVYPGGQQLSVGDNDYETQALDELLEFAKDGDAPHGYNVEAAIALAKSEIGTSRPTGWNMPGECISSVVRWLEAGDVVKVGSRTPVENYIGAIRLTPNFAKPGDVIQYEHLEFPHSWVTGVHTVLVTGVNSDGTLDIIESNVPYGSGLVSERKGWTPAPPPGFQAVVWRF